MRILLTGGSGFLGNALALHWLRCRHEIALLLRPTSSLHRMGTHADFFDIGYCVTDEDVSAFVKKVQPDVVVHTACAYGRHGETPLDLFDVNQRLGLVILQALREECSHSVCFVNTGSGLASEVSPYALSKHQFSEWGHLFASQAAGNLKFVNIQLQHMYGPGDDESKFTTHVLHACQRNEPELKLTAGEQLRDFIYIDDVVAAYDVLLMKHQQLASNLNIEVGTGRAPSIRQFVEIVHRLTSSQTKLIFGAMPYRANEAMHCVANIDQINQLGWYPKFDLDAGLRRTIELEMNR